MSGCGNTNVRHTPTASHIMSFIATPPPHHAWDPQPSAEKINNDGFFPDIDPADVRSTIRINGTVTEQRLVESIRAAMSSINRELAPWRQEQVSAGHQTLNDVPDRQVAGESVLHGHYLRAVYQTVHADLAERYRDFDTTASGERRAQDLDTTIDDARRNARWAVSDILGRTRLTAELI